MMRILIFSLSILLSSCFSTIMDDDYGSIEPELKPFVDSFVKEAKLRGIVIDTWNLKIRFNELSNEAGLTLYSTTQILIDSSSYEYSANPEALIFHELGHLYLKRDHDNQMLEDSGIPKSIMCSVACPLYTETLSYRRQYFIDELFLNTDKAPTWFY